MENLGLDERDDRTDDNRPSAEVKGEYESDPCVKGPALFFPLTEQLRQVMVVGYGSAPSSTRLGPLIDSNTIFSSCKEIFAQNID